MVTFQIHKATGRGDSQGPRSQVRFLGCPTERGDSSYRSHRVTKVRPPGPPRRTECTGCHRHPVSLGSLAPPQKNGPKQGRSCGWKSDINKEKLGMNAILPDFMVVIWCYMLFPGPNVWSQRIHHPSPPVRPFWSLKGWRILDGNSRSHNSKKDHKPRTMPKVISRSFSMSSFGLSLWWSNKLPKKKVGFPKWIQMVD